MSSSTDNTDKPTNTSTPTTPPQQTPGPPPADLFNCIRRFTDHHIASVLHSLIGLPTMPPPPTSNWIMDEEDAPPRPTSTSTTTAVAPTPTPNTSTSTTEESQSQQSQSARGRMVEYSLLGERMFRPEDEEKLALVWKQMRTLHRDFTAPFLGGDVWGTGMMGKRELGLLRRIEGGEETELDAYNVLAPPSSQVGAGARGILTTTTSSSTTTSTSTPAEEDGKLRVVETVATTRSYTGPDGVTRTTYTLRKRFSDGSEERVEEDRTTGIGAATTGGRRTKN
ncbi:uncharacterized protein LAJ45_04751 [Morchella importuna]|uniref:uncharacterized protein n=1 Tax=Morchella importuna TaxID=1174673 RepID=UPI001E8E20C1|nr:uncharacterized protein LAJ45_04751 [Morchella importuna]KAH8151050.1 hypothetical protein LAJ45_04751 [Morchella importuna]